MRAIRFVAIVTVATVLASGWSLLDRGPDPRDRLAVTAVSGEADLPATCEDDGPCQVPATVTVALRSLGDWTYDTVVEAYRPDQRQGDEDEQAWTVRWAPSVVHPRLDAESELGRVRELPPRASIEDRQGRPLTDARS